MEKHYVIFVEFAVLAQGRQPVTQTLEVHSAGPEFSVLLQTLNDCSDIVALHVNHRGPKGTLVRMTKDDVGSPHLRKIR